MFRCRIFFFTLDIVLLVPNGPFIFFISGQFGIVQHCVLFCCGHRGKLCGISFALFFCLSPHPISLARSFMVSFLPTLKHSTARSFCKVKNLVLVNNTSNTYSVSFLAMEFTSSEFPHERLRLSISQLYLKLPSRTQYKCI